MAGAEKTEKKGFMVGGMHFGTGDDGPAEQVEGPLLPLRILCVTSLVPGPEANAGASAPETPLRLDLTQPEQIFDRIKPRAVIEVPSVLHEGKPTKIEFAPTSAKSFRPDGMVTEIKLLRVLMEGRAVLERMRQGVITPTQAQPQLDRLWESSPFVQEVLGLAPSPAAKANEPVDFGSAPVARSASEATADSILDMVDMGDGGGSSAPAARSVDQETGSKLGKLIAEVAKSGRRGGPTRPSEAVPRVEQAIGAQIGAILQHPEVRRLERAYRGVRFLFDRSQRIPGILLDVVAIAPEGAAATFARVAKRGGDVPYSFAIVDCEIDGTAKAFTDLVSIGETAEEHVIPALVNGDVGLLGVGDLASVEHIDNKLGLFTAPHRAPWRSAANKQALRWVSIVMNGFLARGPYDKQTSRVRGSDDQRSAVGSRSFRLDRAGVGDRLAHDQELPGDGLARAHRRDEGRARREPPRSRDPRRRSDGRRADAGVRLDRLAA